MRRSKMIRMFLFHLITLLFGYIMLYPLLWMFFSSFKDNSEIFLNAHELLPKRWLFKNYVDGWKGFAGYPFSVFFKNSFIVTVIGTIGAVISSAIVAYGFARCKFKGKGFWFGCMILTMLLPYQVVMIPQYIMFQKLGWVNSFKPLLVPAFLGQPFFIFLMIQFIRGIPNELDEAAKIDGCSKYSIFTRIILPLISPALITSAIFSFLWRWDDFLGPLLYLSKPELYTVSLGLRMFSDPTAVSNWGAAFAMATLSLVPSFIIFIFFQRYLVEGIVTTGLKG
ncbi:carbohydrate ABC transporter permease [Anaerocellum diazotrophicum]|uniref:ABC transporter permease protein YesQ n=1 Tax=Caldicellulosiruptor diazotrophicus TaxID=2806205 RepID=A0ABM7NKA5_9FIRM|nr:carbohydrate ABC transporter permease [Caldicellulosiruptor diazotrophicus]BCS80543.1 putative ABC transporter permease protein YesQ [Caldicellulosiruptor diazotrophicus]